MFQWIKRKLDEHKLVIQKGNVSNYLRLCLVKSFNRNVTFSIIDTNRCKSVSSLEQEWDDALWYIRKKSNYWKPIPNEKETLEKLKKELGYDEK